MAPPARRASSDAEVPFLMSSPYAPALSLADHVCVVALHLDVLEADFELLDAAERARAVRFATPQLQRRFIAAHSGLRQVLAQATGRLATALVIAQNALGKPFLPAESQLHFSLSHCGGQALVALADAPLGVDIEALIQRDTGVLATQILTPAELSRWQFLPQYEQIESLTEAWTRKEALLKACGLGLRTDPSTLDASPGEAAVPAGGRFWLSGLSAAPGHCAALAQSLPAKPVQRFRLRAQGLLESEASTAAIA
jgi:4'-phosphopantetheinyl transferase